MAREGEPRPTERPDGEPTASDATRVDIRYETVCTVVRVSSVACNGAHHAQHSSAVAEEQPTRPLRRVAQAGRARARPLRGSPAIDRLMQSSRPLPPRMVVRPLLSCLLLPCHALALAVVPVSVVVSGDFLPAELQEAADPPPRPRSPPTPRHATPRATHRPARTHANQRAREGAHAENDEGR